MKKTAIFFFLTFFIFACKNDKHICTQEDKVVTIFIPKEIKQERILEHSQLIDDSFTVKLETKKECLIGIVSKVQIENNRIYILDSYKSVGLYEFDMTGNFVRKIGNKGKGPGEYTSPRTFAVYDKKIVIYDGVKKRLLTYDIDGKFLSSSKIEPKGIVNMAIVDKNNYFFDTHFKNTKKARKDSYSLITTNDNAEVTKSFFELGKNGNRASSLASTSSFSQNDTLLLYNPTFSNKIYTVADKTILLKYSIDFENKIIPDNAFDIVRFGDLRNEIGVKNYSYFNNEGGFHFLKNKLFFTTRTGANREERYVFNLKSNSLYKINFENDQLDFGFYVKSLCVYKDYIVDYSFPLWFLQDEKFALDKIKGSKIEHLIKESKTDDNPVLLFNRIRDNIKL